MKKMRDLDNKIVYEVTHHYMTKNFWEYYVINDPEYDKESDGDIKFCLVLGIEQEFGGVSLNEIKPYLINALELNDKTDLMPPPGFEWVSNDTPTTTWDEEGERIN